MGASCHVTNDDTGLYDITAQGHSGSMTAAIKGKLHTKACQVDGSEKLHILWPMKHCSKVHANLFLLTCKLLLGRKISSDCKNKIVVKSISGNTILDQQIKMKNSLVVGIEFSQE